MKNKRLSLRRSLLVLLALALFGWGGYLTWRTEVNYAELKTFKQEITTELTYNSEFNQQIYEGFIALSQWARDVDAYLASGTPMKYAPVQYNPSPRRTPRRTPSYVRMDSNQNYQGVAVSGMLCIVNVKDGSFTCQVP